MTTALLWLYFGKFNSGGNSPASIGAELQRALLSGGRGSLSELNDAHACGKEVVAFAGNPHAARRLASRALTNRRTVNDNQTLLQLHERIR